jgi:hypothetical protein
VSVAISAPDDVRRAIRRALAVENIVNTKTKITLLDDTAKVFDYVIDMAPSKEQAPGAFSEVSTLHQKLGYVPVASVKIGLPGRENVLTLLRHQQQ